MSHKFFTYFITTYLSILFCFTVINLFPEYLKFAGYSIGVTRNDSRLFITQKIANPDEHLPIKVIRQNVKNEFFSEEVAKFDGVKYLTSNGDYIFISELLGYVVFYSDQLGAFSSLLKTKLGVLFFYIIPTLIMNMYLFYADELKRFINISGMFYEIKKRG